MSLSIHPLVQAHIRHHLESAYPYEACGFLLGYEKNGQREVLRAVEADNKSTDNQRRRFVIDGVEYMRVEKQALKEGFTLLGIYHSHPDHPAIPSEHDLEYAQSFFSYLILSIHNGKSVDTRSYQLQDGIFSEEIILNNVKTEIEDQLPIATQSSILMPRHDGAV